MDFLKKEYTVSERRACQVLSMARSSHRYASALSAEKLALITRIHELSHAHPRYGYRKIYWLLRREGIEVSRERVRILRRREGLKVIKKVKRRRNLGRSTAYVREATQPNHVWSYDFVHDASADGRTLRCLTVIDEYTRRCLAIPVRRGFTSRDVINTLRELIAVHGHPTFMRSDNGSEFVAHKVQEWLATHNVGTRYIEPGHPWENGTNESFNGVFRDGCLDRCLFADLRDARAQIEMYRKEYNEVRPHGSLHGRTPCQFLRDWQGALAPVQRVA